MLHEGWDQFPSPTGILEPGVSAYMSQTMANHSSPRTTKVYDRRQDDISLDEVERIVI